MWDEQAAAANASRLEEALSGLRAALRHDNFKEFWSQVKDTNSLFKNAKPLDRTVRDRLWREFGSLCEDAKAAQTTAHERRQDISRQKRQLVERRLEDAYWQANPLNRAAT